MKLWYSNGVELIGPIQAELVKELPSRAAIFHITSPEWLERTGWKPTSHIEVHARPLPQDRHLPRDIYGWEKGS